MRKLMLTAAIVLGAAGMTFAQTNATVTVTATVITPVSITSGATLAFGNVTQGATATINPTSSNAAELTVTGEASTPITISWNTDVTLTDASGSNPITFSPSLYGSETAFGSNGTSLTNSANSSGNTYSDGKYYITVGGSINTGTAPTGSYSTNYTNGIPLTVTVTY